MKTLETSKEIKKIEVLKKVRTSLSKEILIDRDIYTTGICYYVRKYTGYSINNFIPELLKYKPADAFLYWFDLDKKGHEERIDIINKTISDLENSL